MMPTEVFAGIDVAFAKKNRLPVCLCSASGGRLHPLELCRHEFPEPPRGRGNRAALNPGVVTAFAQETLQYLRSIEAFLDVQITRIAIDASRAPKAEGTKRRAAECAMDARGISCIPTPSLSEFEAIVEKARAHLEAGGAVAKLPHANQLWMLVGFETFRALGDHYECIEVFPQATIRVLGCRKGSKFTGAGLQEQYAAAARATGWGDTVFDLSRAVYGPRHDKLDAYLAAWVASLPEDLREPCGCLPDDVIWIPAPSACLRP